MGPTGSSAIDTIGPLPEGSLSKFPNSIWFCPRKDGSWVGSCPVPLADGCAGLTAPVRSSVHRQRPYSLAHPALKVGFFFFFKDF